MKYVVLFASNLVLFNLKCQEKHFSISETFHFEMLKLHVCISWKYNLHLILRAEAFTKSHANLWAVVDFNPPRTSLLLVYYSRPFSQLLVTLVQEELSVGVLSYYSFSKETNMPHISEEETTYAAPEFVLLTTDKATRGGKWKHKWFGIMATFFRFAVCHKDAFSTFHPPPHHQRTCLPKLL